MEAEETVTRTEADPLDTAKAALRVFLASLPYYDGDIFERQAISDTQVMLRGIAELLDEIPMDGKPLEFLYGRRFVSMAEGALWNVESNGVAPPTVGDLRLTLQQALLYLEPAEQEAAA